MPLTWALRLGGGEPGWRPLSQGLCRWTAGGGLARDLVVGPGPERQLRAPALVKVSLHLIIHRHPEYLVKHF